MTPRCCSWSGAGAPRDDELARGIIGGLPAGDIDT